MLFDTRYAYTPKKGHWHAAARHAHTTSVEQTNRVVGRGRSCLLIAAAPRPKALKSLPTNRLEAESKPGRHETRVASSGPTPADPSCCPAKASGTITGNPVAF